MLEFLTDNTMGVVNAVGILILWLQSALKDRKVDQEELKELASLVLEGALAHLSINNNNEEG